MSRPRKYRRVCQEPQVTSFSPTNNFIPNNNNIIHLSVDEYEAIRLIDYEGMNQEECANHMEVARTTAQKVYNEARKKIAMMLIDGRGLNIQGGSYMVCQESRPGNRCRGCGRGNNKKD